MTDFPAPGRPFHPPGTARRPSFLRASPRRWRRPTAAALAGLAALVLSACGTDIPGSRGGTTIETETFIQGMVDLQRQASTRAGNVLAPGDAERILEAHRIQPDDLRRFVEVHGQNVPFMNLVWSEIDRRLEEDPTEPQARG
ncbi:MAG: hypothetical protein WD013_02525 [Gemmatimonadota bacterium]